MPTSDPIGPPDHDDQKLRGIEEGLVDVVAGRTVCHHEVVTWARELLVPGPATARHCACMSVPAPERAPARRDPRTKPKVSPG